MNVTTEEISDTRKKLTVSFTGDETAAEEKALLREVTQQAKIPGFRPGKAPEAMVRKRHAKAIADDFKRRVLSKAYDKGVKESELNVYSIVEVDEPELEAGKEAEVGITVDILPEFELPEYTGIDTKVPPVEVGDEEVEQALENIRRERSQFNPVERAAEKGDYVQVSYTGTVEGEAIADKLTDNRQAVWGTQNKTWEEAGAEGDQRFGVPAIIDNLEGMSAGDKKTVEQELPEDFPIEDLRGKTASYEIEVHEVRERVLPELNEEFFKSVQVEDLDDLKKRIRESLEQNKSRQRTTTQRRQIIDELLNRVSFNIPESAVENETQRVMGEVMRQNMQRGVAEEEFEKHKEELYQNARQSADRNVRVELLSTKIAEQEEIEVTEQDMQQVIMNQAMQSRRRPEEIVKELQENRGQVQRLRLGILVDKTLEFLCEKANVEESAEAEPEHSH